MDKALQELALFSLNFDIKRNEFVLVLLKYLRNNLLAVAIFLQIKINRADKDRGLTNPESFSAVQQQMEAFSNFQNLFELK